MIKLSTTGGFNGFLVRIQEKAISKVASGLISKSRGTKSNANYESAGEHGLDGVLEGKLIHFLVI